MPLARTVVWTLTGVFAWSAAAVAGCAGRHSTSPAKAAPAHATAGGSNVARADYAGSRACADCHADVAAKWEKSPMHRMTRDARGADVRGPFDGTRWRFHDDAVVLEVRGADRFVRIEPGGGAAEEYRVTRVIGGRTREDYAGVDAARGGEEVVLPVSFVYATGALRYKGYSVMIHERATLRAGPVWSQTCIFCHNTVPEMDRLLASIAGPGAPRYQGEEVDALLPPDRRAHVRVTDEPAFAAVARAEIERLGGIAAPEGEGARAVARRTIDVVRDGFAGGALIDVGIGCEACHGGARAHAERPESVRPSLDPQAPWLAVDLPKASHAASVNRVCARCHQVLFSRYPYTWEGGKRSDATAGGSHINSGEGRDFLLGGCADAMACTACHDPHGADSPDVLSRLATPAGNVTCTGCHRELASAGALQAHAHHDPAGAAGSCVACHMPRKNMGLDGRLTRYHRIGSPTDPARVLGDRPLECALCHADASVGALVDAMEKWWPVRYPRQRLEELYGSLGANVMRATLERGKPHEKAVAIGVLAEAGAAGGAPAKVALDAAPLVVRELQGEYPLVREWASRALAKLGMPVPQAPAPPPATDSGELPED